MSGIAKYLRWRFVGKQNDENSILSVNGNNTHINVFDKAVEFIDDCTALWLISYYTVSRPSILFEFWYRGEFGKKKISIFDGKENSVKLKDTANASTNKSFRTDIRGSGRSPKIRLNINVYIFHVPSYGNRSKEKHTLRYFLFTCFYTFAGLWNLSPVETSSCLLNL